MKYELVGFALLLCIASVSAMACSFDSSPNMWGDFRASCLTNQSNLPRCYAYTKMTSNNIIVGEYPRGTFDYDREKYLIPDNQGGFVVTIPLGGEYVARANYTLNVTCFNTSSYDSSNFTFVTSLARPPDYIGEFAEWAVVYGRYLAFGIIVLFIIVGGAYVIFRIRRR